VLRDVTDSYEALTMDGELGVPDDLMAEIKTAQAKEDRGVKGRGDRGGVGVCVHEAVDRLVVPVWAGRGRTAGMVTGAHCGLCARCVMEGLGIDCVQDLRLVRRLPMQCPWPFSKCTGTALGA